MLTIWKFEIPGAGAVTIGMPRGAMLLDVQVQGEQAQLWALVDSEAETVRRRFLVIGTGHAVHLDHCDPESFRRKYVGTFLSPDGRWVFHLFDCGEAY